MVENDFDSFKRKIKLEVQIKLNCIIGLKLYAPKFQIHAPLSFVDLYFLEYIYNTFTFKRAPRLAKE